MKTGFKDLDSNIKLNNGELIVIASRPSIGKTTFALNILSNIAIKEKKGVLLLNLEESKESITKKLIISNSMIEKEKFDLYNQYKEEKIEKPELSEEDWDRIAYGIKLLKDAPIYISSEAPLSIDDICKKSKKMKLEKNIEAIIIDYLQLIKFDKEKLLSRDDEITEILRRLKVLAKELDIPVIVISQLSRASKERKNQKPMIVDFSSSKYGITKYTDKILFLYRDLDYTENRKSNIIEVIIAKNNDGNINTIKLGWLPEYCKIGNAKEIVVNNTNKIANMIDNIKLKDENKIYPKVENSKEVIKQKCYDKAYQLYVNVNNYYCKRQVKTSLNREYDLKECNENNRYFNNDDKIRDLEIILEMFERGILKEKKEIKDDYNLINSRAIGDYCREIGHKFNTEELAVLVFRNNRMSIDEKIEKYNDLINNYPDMEVIERINCNHYNSVRTLIKKEIQRLKKLKEKLIKEDENSIYTWTEYNASTLEYSSNRDLDHTFRTYKEAIEDIKSYVKEYNDTISFTITKKYFNNKKSDIITEYFVENKKIIFNHIKEKYEDLLDIDMIYLNIPTPFKKGDILITKSKSIRNYGDYNEIFVLDYLTTWRENLPKYLSKGNYDSSDMIGSGYYLCGENSTEFVRDHKMDYDCFEYYEGELTGNNRILKDISSFIKGKIELELFVHAYDVFKAEFQSKMPDFYIEDKLRLAGMTESDILKRNLESDKNCM